MSKLQTITKNLPWKIILRLCSLFLLAYFITTFVSWQIEGASKMTYRIENIDYGKERYVEGQMGNPQDTFNNVSSLIKSPVSLLYFDLYFENYRQAERRSDKKKFHTVMNVDINNVYTHQIKFGEKKKVYGNIRGLEFPYLTVSRSFFPVDNIPLASTTPVIGSYYNSFMRPTWQSQLFTYFVAGIPLAYAVLILTNSCYRFVVYGEPFTNKNGRRKFQKPAKQPPLDGMGIK